MIDAVVPAHNEEQTVATTVRALLRAQLLGRVIVVDDGSTDRTASVAAEAGAEVLRLPTNQGKAGAMLVGVASSFASSIAFFDADALVLLPAHVELLVQHFDQGFTQVCGLQDHGSLTPLAAMALPLITGQRIVRRWVLEALPASCRGYSVEIAINYTIDAAGGSTCLVPLPGARFRSKGSKVGFLRGYLRDMGTLRDALGAGWALEQTNGAACRLDRGRR